MKALVFNGVGQIAVEDRPKPTVKNASDAVIKLTRTTICGSDLHIIQGHVPTVEKGRVIGHEGVGVVESVGKDVQDFKVYTNLPLRFIGPLAETRLLGRRQRHHCLYYLLRYLQLLQERIIRSVQLDRRLEAGTFGRWDSGGVRAYPACGCELTPCAQGCG